MSKSLAFAVSLGLIAILAVGAAPKAAGQDEPDHTIVLRNIEFNPNRVQMALGDKIRFINQDPFEHNVYLVRTANRNIALIPPTTLKAGESVTITIEQTGLFTLYCTIHGGMIAKMTTTDSFELSEEEKEAYASIVVLPPIVKTGEDIFWSRGQCHRCHRIGDRGYGLRGPNLQDIGFRAKVTAEKLSLGEATDYIVQSIQEPSAYIVEGYSDDMPHVYQPPINLSEQDLTAVVTYLQSQGGEVDEWAINFNQQKLAAKLPMSPFHYGNPRRGEIVFGRMGCGSCHTVGERKAVSIAPELTAIGKYRNWTWLAESVINPNAEIGANWRSANVYLKPGVSRTNDELFGGEEVFFDDDDDDDDETEEVAAAPTPQAPLDQAYGELDALRQRIQRLEDEQAQSLGAEGAEEAEFEPNAEAPTTGTQTAETSGVLPENFSHGDVVPGVLRENSAKQVRLLVAPDRIETFPADQVALVEVTKLTRMAADYSELMTYRQFADLIGYLESLRGVTQDELNLEAQSKADAESTTETESKAEGESKSESN